ncbi:MAG TPA: hypothetical protein PKL26_04985, partial [Methanolinea sp.]|nr:hypothetical protein [Methanolinea sp.]
MGGDAKIIEQLGLLLQRRSARLPGIQVDMAQAVIDSISHDIIFREMDAQKVEDPLAGAQPAISFKPVCVIALDVYILTVSFRVADDQHFATIREGFHMVRSFDGAAQFIRTEQLLAGFGSLTIFRVIKA